MGAELLLLAQALSEYGEDRVYSPSDRGIDLGLTEWLG